MSSTNPSHDPRRETWQAGDYSQASAQSVLVSELLCEAVELRAGEKVLDVACGTGVTTLAAARRRADVTGVDFAPNALEQAKQRAAFEGIKITLQEGNAEALPFADETFDVVLSTFGAQFVADQEAAASEMVRVCRSGGRIGLANWTPRGFFGHYFKLMADYAPPQMSKTPVPDKPGVLWGTEERLQELFGDKVESMRIERRTSRSRYRSVEEWVEQQTETLGPVVQIMRQLDSETGERFREALSELVTRFNLVSGPDVLLESDYLEVLMVRR
jgi:ubiquinone/menaquinone biosynthesis C-methylase UbiE